MKAYKIMTTQGEVSFTGRYRRELETSNWHDYEKENGVVIHFRKDHIVWVAGDSVEDIKKDKTK